MIRGLALLLLLLLVSGAARAQDSITFGIDWQAEAAYGGYYQAIAKGIYARHGLNVTIRQGGPQVNQAQLLLGGKLDFALASNSFLALNFVAEQLPFVAVAAIFQKDPSVLIAHQDQGNDHLVDLRGKKIMISGDTRAGWWNWLRAAFGYTDDQIRPYTFNLQPFLADPHAIQQGYLMSEPYALQQATHQAPVVLLLADAGFAAYGSLITTSRKLIATNPGLVQRFIDASIEGWYSYLYTDPAPANTLIKQANPEITDGLLAYGHDIMLKRGVVDSGDAETMGIGAMTPSRWAGFTALMVREHLYPATMDPALAYTTEFVNHRTGLPK